MATATAGKNVARQSNLLDVVKKRFGEKSGFKRRIHWLFNAAGVDYFRVNYLTQEDHQQGASYWVEVNNSTIIKVN